MRTEIFVTGATGFIGSHFIGMAVSQGHQIVALTRKGKATNPRLSTRDVFWVESDLDDVHDFYGCQTLVHLAAFGVWPPEKQHDWDACFKTNLVDSLHLWRRAAASGIKHFVICGSCFEYGLSGERYEFIPIDAPLEPTNAYAASKAAASVAAVAFAAEAKVHLTLLRPFHVYGEGESEDRFWPSLRRAALAGEDFPMTAGEQVRDFVPVEEVASKFLEAVSEKRDPPGRAVFCNVGSGAPLSLKDFAQKWWSHWGAKGCLRPGLLPYRKGEVMRYVPELDEQLIKSK